MCQSLFLGNGLKDTKRSKRTFLLRLVRQNGTGNRNAKGSQAGWAQKHQLNITFAAFCQSVMATLKYFQFLNYSYCTGMLCWYGLTVFFLKDSFSAQIFTAHFNLECDWLSAITVDHDNIYVSIFRKWSSHIVCDSLSPSSDRDKPLQLLLNLEEPQRRLVEHQFHLCVSARVCVCFHFRRPSGGGGETWHGEGEARQQADPVQPAAGPCGSTLSHVKPQEHGEHRFPNKLLLVLLPTSSYSVPRLTHVTVHAESRSKLHSTGNVLLNISASQPPHHSSYTETRCSLFRLDVCSEVALLS